MSVGGFVINTVLRQDGKQRVETKDPVNPQLDHALCITVDGEHDIHFGDSIWWQSGYAYWSRKGEFQDKMIPRYGTSYTTNCEAGKRV